MSEAINKPVGMGKGFANMTKDLHAAHQRIASLEAEVERRKQDHIEACELVARMLRKATGGGEATAEEEA